MSITSIPPPPTSSNSSSTGLGRPTSTSSNTTVTPELVIDYFAAIAKGDSDTVRELLARHRELTRVRQRGSEYRYDPSFELDAYKFLGAYLGQLSGLHVALLLRQDTIARNIMDVTFDQDLHLAFGMGVFNLQEAARPNILQLKPYRSARDDYQEGILLDANENSYRAIGHDHNPLHLNRYPDPHQLQLKRRLRVLRPDIKSEEQIFVGVGSDEVLDMIVRIFCRPGVDQILITPPTYGMYAVTAQINDIGVLKSLLTPNNFQLNVEEIKATIDKNVDTLKVIFLCSPGNPTGSSLTRPSIEEILNYPYKGVVVVDEAYVDFSDAPSTTNLLQKYPNLIVMQTLSKSFGLAGIRLGVGFSHSDIIRLMNNTKAPYNVSSLTSHAALEALTDSSLQAMRDTVTTMNQARSELQTTLATFPDLAPPLGTTDANFLLVPVLGHSSRQPSNLRALHVYQYLAQTLKVVIRYRANEPHCPGCLRITIGTPEDHRVLVDGLRQAIQANLTD